MNKKDIDMKINVQSPGPIELSGTIKTLILVTLFWIGLFGGEVDFFHLFKFKTDGLIGAIKTIIETLRSKKDDQWKQEMLHLIKELKVEMPKIKSIEKTNEEEE